jgi:hypothetical protein
MTRRGEVGRETFSKAATRTTGILVSAAAAALLVGPVATAQSLIRDATNVQPLQTVTQILRGGVAPAGDDANTQARSSVAGRPESDAAFAASAGLTITPIFDPTITNDPNAAQIEATINTAIADFQAKFADPITVTIRFKLMTSGLAQSSKYVGTISYSALLAALKGDAKTNDDFTAMALLPSLSTNPVNGSSTVNVTTANFRAVGFAVNRPPDNPMELSV